LSFRTGGLDSHSRQRSSGRTTHRRPDLPGYRRDGRRPAFLDRPPPLQKGGATGGLYSRFATKLPALPKRRARLV